MPSRSKSVYYSAVNALNPRRGPQIIKRRPRALFTYIVALIVAIVITSIAIAQHHEADSQSERVGMAVLASLSGLAAVAIFVILLRYFLNV